MTLIPVEKDSPSDPSQTMRMQRSSGAWGAQSQSQDPISRSQKAQNSLPMKSGKPRRAYRLASIFWWLNEVTVPVNFFPALGRPGRTRRVVSERRNSLVLVLYS